MALLISHATVDEYITRKARSLAPESVVPDVAQEWEEKQFRLQSPDTYSGDRGTTAARERNASSNTCGASQWS